MASGVRHVDLELYLTGWYRDALAARDEWPADAEVDRVEREPLAPVLLVIRDDGGPATGLTTREAQVGLSILAGTREDPKRAKDLAELVLALAPRIPSGDPANPVAAVLGSTAPTLVPEAQERARAYCTLRLAVVGQPF